MVQECEQQSLLQSEFAVLSSLGEACGAAETIPKQDVFYYMNLQVLFISCSESELSLFDSNTQALRPNELLRSPPAQMNTNGLTRDFGHDLMPSNSK